MARRTSELGEQLEKNYDYKLPDLPLDGGRDRRQQTSPAGTHPRTSCWKTSVPEGQVLVSVVDGAPGCWRWLAAKKVPQKCPDLRSLMATGMAGRRA